MAWKYSFGFKLSGSGKARLSTYLINQGKKIIDVGWDYIVVDTKLNNTQITAIKANVFLEEQI